MLSEDEVLELLDNYVELTEKQDEIIIRLSKLVAKLTTELAHLRNLMNVEADDSDMELDRNIIEEVKAEYEKMKMEP